MPTTENSKDCQSGFFWLSWSYLKISLITIFLLLMANCTNAANYYVRTDGSNSNTGTTNNTDGAWQTIDYAADHVSPGDVVRVQAGTYSERVTPGIKGTDVNTTVTFVADGTVVVCGWDLTSSEYIRIIGFTMDTDAGSCSMSNGCVMLGGINSHLEFWNNTFRDGYYNGIRIGVNDVIHNSLIIGNTLYNFGVGNGSGVAIGIRGNNNLIAYNEIYNSHPDAFTIFGSGNRWTNNYIHDLSEASGGHSDIFQTGSSTNGWNYNLIEANFQVGMGNLGDEHTAQISHGQASTYCPSGCGDMTENIFRRNVWHNVSQATIGINQTSDGTISRTRYYNNTTAEACENAPTNRYGLAWYGTGTTDGFIYNNIEYESWGNSATSNLEVFYVTGGLNLDYNLAYDPDGNVSFAAPWNSQQHSQSNANPRFADYANDDFHLGIESSARNNGGELATVSGSGSGTTFALASGQGGFFRGDNINLSQYEGGLVTGDKITVGTDEATVINVMGDNITVAESFNWTDGDPVYFGDSNTPDIGAYPYIAGGYGLAAIFGQSENSITVTPSNNDLVRFIVCYENGIPISVDNVAPYVCPAMSGSPDIRIYPLYADKTLYRTATPGTPDAISPDNPTGLQVS